MESKKKEVLFIKSEDVSSDIIESLQKMDCNAHTIKLLKFEYKSYEENLKKSLSRIKEFSSLALNSVNSAISLKNLSDFSPEIHDFIKNNLEIFVVGEKTAKYLEENLNLRANIIGKNYENLVEKINEFYEKKEACEKSLYLIGTLSDLSKSSIKPKNWDYEEIIVYGTREVSEKEFEEQFEGILKKSSDFPNIIVYFSASNIRFFSNLLESYENNKNMKFDFKNTKHICFGQKTREEFENFINKLKLQGVILDEKNIHISKLSNMKEVLEIIEKIL